MTSDSSKAWIRQDFLCLLLEQNPFPREVSAWSHICLRSEHRGACSPEVSVSSNALCHLHHENTIPGRLLPCIQMDRCLPSLGVGHSRGYSMVPSSPGPRTDPSPLQRIHRSNQDSRGKDLHGSKSSIFEPRTRIAVGAHNVGPVI